MIKDILFKSKVEKTMLLNSRLFQLRKLGFIKDNEISSFTKNIAIFSGVFINVIRNLLLNIFYFFSLYLIIEVINKKFNSNIFVLFYIFLTIFGSLINSKALRTSNTKYHLVVLLNMNTKSYTLSDIFSNVIISFIFHFIALLILKTKLGLGTYFIISLTLFMAFTKVIGEVFNILYFKRFKNSFLNNTILYFSIFGLLILVGVLLSIFRCYISLNTLVYTDLILMVFSIISSIYLIRINDYKYLYTRLINITKYTDTDDTLIPLRNDSYDINSFKDPISFINIIFFKRYSNIILSPIYRNTIIISVILGFLICFSLYDLRIGVYIVNYIIKYFMVIYVFIYLLNKTSLITKIMFNSCDKHFNSYSFYNDKSFCHKLYSKRLKSLILINLLPVFAFSSLVFIFLVLTTSMSILTLILMFISFNLLSIFFTTHFLSMYYLFKPYDKDSRVVDLRYQVINSILVLSLFFMLRLKINFNLLFVLTICFCTIYVFALLFVIYKKKNLDLKSIG